MTTPAPTRPHVGGRLRRALVALAALATLVGAGFVAPERAEAQPMGHIVAPFDVGYFYGTFGEDPELLLLAGGTAEEFCADNPTDPFSAKPGQAMARIFVRDDSVQIKVEASVQPIYLYEVDGPGPVWIEQVCADLLGGLAAPEPIASGSARLKVRITDGGDIVDVYNEVRGQLTGVDGTEYLVFGSADLIVENGVPVGNPADFVSFNLIEIGG